MRIGHKLLAKAHKWIGLVLGIQVLFWTGSGFYMSLVPIETIRSEHTIPETAPVSVEAAALSHLPEGLAFRDVTAVAPLGTPLLLVTLPDGAQALHDASTGSAVPAFTESEIADIARRAFRGEAREPLALLLATEPGDYRGPLPVWQVSMNDAGGTRLYIDPATGKVRARRSDVWRVYDFLWMLHIMDYDTRDDFNHPLLIVAAGSAMLFSLTGLGLLVFRFRRRDFGLKARSRRG